MDISEIRELRLGKRKLSTDNKLYISYACSLRPKYYLTLTDDLKSDDAIVYNLVIGKLKENILLEILKHAKYEDLYLVRLITNSIYKAYNKPVTNLLIDFRKYLQNVVKFDENPDIVRTFIYSKLSEKLKSDALWMERIYGYRKYSDSYISGMTNIFIYVQNFKHAMKIKDRHFDVAVKFV